MNKSPGFDIDQEIKNAYLEQDMALVMKLMLGNTTSEDTKEKVLGSALYDGNLLLVRFVIDDLQHPLSLEKAMMGLTVASQKGYYTLSAFFAKKTLEMGESVENVFTHLFETYKTQKMDYNYFLPEEKIQRAKMADDLLKMALTRGDMNHIVDLIGIGADPWTNGKAAQNVKVHEQQKTSWDHFINGAADGYTYKHLRQFREAVKTESAVKDYTADVFILAIKAGIFLEIVSKAAAEKFPPQDLLEKISAPDVLEKIKDRGEVLAVFKDKYWALVARDVLEALSGMDERQDVLNYFLQENKKRIKIVIKR